MKSILIVPLLAISLPAAAVFKCQTANGKTTFQEIPCAVEHTQSSVRTFTAPSPAGNERSGAERSAINVAILQGYPVRGMTVKELQTAMGNPTRVSTGDSAIGRTEERIYEPPNGTYYVYTENGVVSAIQNSEAATSTGALQAARHCPSELEIKNDEVSANSITLSRAERQARRQKIAQMRDCRAQ
jgi:hypothetical protein